MSTERKPTPQERWKKLNMRSINLRIAIHTEADILKRLDAQPNRSGYIKRLIREDITRNPDPSDT